MNQTSLLRRAAALLVAVAVVVQPVAAQVGRAFPVRALPLRGSAPAVLAAGPSTLIPSASPTLSLPVAALQAAPSPVAVAAPVAAAAAAPALPTARAAAFASPVDAVAAPVSAEASAVSAARTFDAAGARAALEGAVQGDYSVTVLARRTETGRQLVVLLGESHVKSAATARAGRRVLDRFKDYALEGYDTNSSWAGRLFWWCETKTRAVTTAALPGGVDAGSTIKEAARLAAADPSLRRYDLETGHKPGLAEKIGLLSPFVKLAAPLVVLGTLMAVPFVSGAGVALAVAGTGAAYTFLGAALPEKWLHGRSLGALFPLETGIVRGRDKTMARSVAAAAGSEQAGPLLAVIGRDHAAGMAKILAREYGFQPATLDALSDESQPGPASPPSPDSRAAAVDGAKRIAFAAGLGALTLAAWGGVSALAAAFGYVTHSSYYLAFMTGENFIGLAMLCIVIAPFIEETLFRAGLFDGLRRGLLRVRAPGAAASVVAAGLSAVIFAAFHELSDPLFFGLHVFGALLLALAYRRAGLAGSTLAHMINNAGFILSGSALVLSPSVAIAAAVLAAVWAAALAAGKLAVKPKSGWVLGSVWEADWD